MGAKSRDWSLLPTGVEYVAAPRQGWHGRGRGGRGAARSARDRDATQVREGQNVAIKADRDHVCNTIAENFDVSRLTGRQLEEIAEQLARMKAPAAARKKPPRRALPAQASDSDEEAYTETSVAGTEAEPATEPERPIRVVRHIVGRRR